MRRGGVGGLQVQQLVLAAAAAGAKLMRVSQRCCRSAAARHVHYTLRASGARTALCKRCSVNGQAPEHQGSPVGRTGISPGSRPETYQGRVLPAPSESSASHPIKISASLAVCLRDALRAAAAAQPAGRATSNNKARRSAAPHHRRVPPVKGSHEPHLRGRRRGPQGFR